MLMYTQPFSTIREATHPALTLSAGLSSGFAHLDRLLPGGGWPTGGVTEIVARRGHVNPASLLLPALAPLSWEGRWVSWIGGDCPERGELQRYGFDTSRVLTVHPRHGDEPLRLAEQALAAGNCGAILVCLERLERFAVSRLQQAVRGGDTAVFVFLPHSATIQPLAGELRVYVSTHSRRLAVEILACRGGAGSVLQLEDDGGQAGWSGYPAATPRLAPQGARQNSRMIQNFPPGRELMGS